MGTKKVFMGTKTVQKQGRIVLDYIALKNSGLQEGDEVDIYWDMDSNDIIIQKPEQAKIAEGNK